MFQIPSNPVRYPNGCDMEFYSNGINLGCGFLYLTPSSVAPLNGSSLLGIASNPKIPNVLGSHQNLVQCPNGCDFEFILTIVILDEERRVMW
jgi:hypothetical protein